MTSFTSLSRLGFAAATGALLACSAPAHVTPAPPPAVEPAAASSPVADAHRCSSIPVPSTAIASTDLRTLAIVFVGTRGTDAPEKVCDALKTLAGAALDMNAVDADVRRLFETGLFDDVSVVREPVPGGIAVVFEPKPLGVFASARIEGVRGIAGIDDGMLPAAGLLDPVMIHATTREIQSRLAREGYRHADVLVRHDARDDGAAELVFRVEANVETHLHGVTFDGSSKLGEAELLHAMTSKIGGPVSDELLAYDALVLSAAYYDHGFLDVHIDDPVVVESKDATLGDVTYRIHEGDPYRVGKVHVTGDLLDPERDYIRHYITLTTGEVFSRTTILGDIDRITEYQRARGFPSTVEPETALNPEKKTVDLTLHVKPANAR